MNKFLILFVLLFVSCVNPPKNAEVTSAPIILEHVPESAYNLDRIDKKDERRVNPLIKEIKSQKCEDYCELIPPRKVNKIRSKDFSYKSIAELQEQSVELNKNSLKSVKSDDLLKNYKKFTSTACPQKLTAAVMNKIDNSISAEKIDSYVYLFNQVAQCPVSSELEQTYLKSALILYNFDKLSEAKIAIKKALEIQTPVDYARINYWAGVILEDSSFYKKVVDNRPYTYHAVASAEKLNISLWNELKKKPKVGSVRKDNLLTNSVELLLRFNKSDEAYSLMSMNLEKLSPEETIYFVKLFNQNARVDVAVKLVSRIALKLPESISEQLISLSFKKEYFDLFEKNSKDYNLDPYLMLSLSKQESGFFIKARSRANAQGLMQLLPSTARTMSKSMAKDLYNAENNVYLGTRYFSTIYSSFNKVDLSLAGYNAGPSNVKKWVNTYGYKDSLLFTDLIPFKETRIYVLSILRNHYFYNNIYGEEKVVAKINDLESSQK